MKIRRATVTAQMASAVLCLTLIGILAVGCDSSEPETAKPPRPVKAMRVVDASSLSASVFPGQANPGREVNLSFRVPGPLVEFSVKVGDHVSTGDIVARIDPKDFESALNSAEGELQMARARATRAEADLKRLESTFRQDPGATSQMAIDRARQVRDSSVAGVRVVEGTSSYVRDQLRYTALAAPFDGEVVETYVENFETILPKQPILRIVDASTIEFVVSVPENLIGYARYVTKATVTFDALPGVSVPAEIKEVGREATRATRTYPVTLVMNQPTNAEILPGMAGEAVIQAELPEGSRELGIQVPATAIFTENDPTKSYVWVIDPTNGMLERREISTGALSESGVLVRSGLQTGDHIVIAGVNLLSEGEKVVSLGDKGQGSGS